jgi:diguanylate cyclase
MLYFAGKYVGVLQFACLLILATASSSYALEPRPASTLTLTTDTREVPISSFGEALCDPQGNLSLEAARTGSYVPLNREQSTSDQCRGYWVRFNLLAGYLPPAGWVLEIPRNWVRADLYYDQDGHSIVLKNGSMLPPPARPFASSLLAFPLLLESNHETAFYLHLVGDTTRYGDARAIDGVIQRLDAHETERRNVLFGQGIYSGIILALVLYNIILFFAIGERAYLYYSLYVLAFGSVWTARTGFLFQYLWPHHPLMESESQFYLVALSIIFSGFFVRHFLATRQQSRWVDRALVIIVVFTAALCLVRILGVTGSSTVILAVDGLVTTVFFAIVGVLFLVRGYRPARFFLVAWTLQLVGNAVYIFAFLRLLPFNFFTYNAAQIGSGVESILLAFALADRVNLLKREKEQEQLQYTRELQEEVKQRTAELSLAVEELKTASVTDPLTGLSNRRRVDAAIQPWLADLQRERMRNLPGITRRHLAICLADLDHFKLVNDELGHALGDKVLQSAAETLRRNVRATAMLARWGGEEFLILDHVTGQQEDMLMAERLRVSLLEDCPEIVLETGRSISLSLGVVRYPFSHNFPQLLDWDQCLALADHALYRAKRAGRNCWRCYRPNEGALRNAIQLQGIEEVRHTIRTHLEQAVDMGLIEVVDEITSDLPVA